LHIDPNVYWDYLLLSMAAVVILSFTWAIYLFLVIRQSPPSTPYPSMKAYETEKEKINQALEYFRARARKSAEIITSPSPVADPS